MTSVQSIRLATRREREAAAQQFQAGIRETLQPRVPLTGSQWADRNFYLSPESSGTEGQWRSLPFQVAWLDVMGADEPRTVTLQKCARIGYTKCLVATVAYYLEHKRRNTMLFQPTDGDAKAFCKDEIDPMVRDVPCMAALADASENRKRDDTLAMKKLGRKILHIMGGKAASNFRRITSDVTYFDELDAFDPEIGDEGDPLSLGDRAITNSAFPKSIRGSTPSTKVGSLIRAEIARAKHVFEFHVACPDCSAMQPMRWSQMQWAEEPRGDPEARAATARHACAACGVLWEYRELTPLLASGQWRSDDRTTEERKDGAPWRGHRIVTGESDPVLLDPEGMPATWPRHVGFQIWAAYSPYMSWSDLVFEWLNAQGHPLKLKTFVNHRLGEAWEDEGEHVDQHELFERRENYKVPASILAVFAAIDVQDNRLEVLFVGFEKDESSRFLGHRVLYGDTEKIESPVWKDATDLVRTTTFARDDGYTLKLDAVGIDSGYRTDTVYRWVLTAPHRRTFPLKGYPGEGHPIAGAPSRQKTTLGFPIDLFGVGVDNAKALVMARLRPDSKSPIRLSLDVTFEHCEQLTAEKRITKYARGFPKREWHKTRPRNELLDLYAYEFALLYILNPAWAALEVERQPRPDAPPVEKPPQSQRGGWVNNWRK